MYAAIVYAVTLRKTKKAQLSISIFRTQVYSYFVASMWLAVKSNLFYYFSTYYCRISMLLCVPDVSLNNKYEVMSDEDDSMWVDIFKRWVSKSAQRKHT